MILVSAISSYDERTMAYLRSLGASAKVMSSPNITLGINFLIMAARILRRLAPFADVEILEQHFKEKPEISGTARKIADTLNSEGRRTKRGARWHANTVARVVNRLPDRS